MVEFVPARTIEARVDGLFAALGDTLVSTPLERLRLDYDGIAGDRHAGALRQSGAREPWYPRGTEMRNERQLSILSRAELAEVARDMEIDRLDPEWIGASITLLGVPHLSLLPPRSILMFEGGVSVRIDGDNGPCSYSGASIAEHFEGRDDIKFLFSKVARHKRGLVGWVERAGEIAMGEAVKIRIWEQWIYPGPDGQA
ncbi:MAG: molybdenum cofactor sulfurase [Hyphomicrobiaceae bacterium]|nr:molybdenum cofactor sulfurase [Hyphomicrobiaceae bacterium]